MAIAQSINIAPPANRKPRHSLLQVAEDLLHLDGDPTALPPAEEIARMWEAGVTFAPESCGTGGTFAACSNDTFGDFGEVVVCADNVEFVPFVVWAAERDSAVGRGAKDLKARAKRLLEANASMLVAAEFQDGTIATAEGYPNLFLASGVAVTQINSGTAMALVQGFAELQERLAICLGGGVGDIHVPIRLLTLLQSAHLIHTKVDPVTGIIRYEDNRGNKVISDAGYTGASPAGVVDATHSTAWAYATGPVAVSVSEVRFTPTTEAEALDRKTNDIRWVAWQTAAATWDGCCLLGANLNACDTCCSGDILA